MVTTALATMEFQDKMADAVRRSQKYVPAELWAQVRALLTPEAAALMGTVTAAWAISHFFGVGQVADAVLLITGGAIYGMSAYQIGVELYSFASTVRGAQTEADLDRAARHFSNAAVLGGTTVLSALLFRSRPARIFHKPYASGARIPRPGPRGPGLFYKPTVRVAPLPDGYLGVTTAYGDIVISSKFPKHVQVETWFHERVHRFFTPRLYFLRDLRVTLKWEGYNRSYLLRYLEEALAEAYAMLRTGGGVLSAVSFPVRGEYVTLARMGQEAKGILLGPVNVGGQAFRVLLVDDRQPAAGGAP